MILVRLLFVANSPPTYARELLDYEKKASDQNDNIIMRKSVRVCNVGSNISRDVGGIFSEARNDLNKTTFCSTFSKFSSEPST